MTELPDVFVNEILANSVTPEVDRIELYNPEDADLSIEGWFLTDDLGQPRKFQIPPGAIVPGNGFTSFTELEFNPTPGVDPSFALDSFGEEVFLIAVDPSGARLDYVAGFNFDDSSAGTPFGRHEISTGEVQVAPLISSTPGGPNSNPLAGPLVITELMYHPSAFEAEFIEIQNISAQPVSLAGSEISGVGYIFGVDAPDLLPGEILIVSELDPSTFRSTYNVPATVEIYGPYPGRLDNGGERVRILLPEQSGIPDGPGLLVAADTVIYSDDAPWPLAADGQGYSLERSETGGYGGEPLHWRDSANPGGSPGLADTPPPGDWRTQFFSGEELNDLPLSGELADADNDGLPNALEYLLGSDPRANSSRATLEVSLVELAGQTYVELSHSVRDGAGEFRAQIERSSGLESWNEAGDTLIQISNNPNGDGTTTVTYRGSESVDPAMDLYFRIRAITTP